MEFIVIEIPQGNDVVESLINIAQSRHAGITVFSGFGLVSEFTFRLPETSAVGSPVEGPFNLITFTGTYMNPNICQASPSLSSIASWNSHFSIFVSNGNQGHVFGGTVEGKIMAAGDVLITAALFRNPDFSLANVSGSLQEMQNDGLPEINTGRVGDEANNSTNTND